MIHNNSIIPKKRKLDCGCYDYPFSKNRCKAHASIESFQKRLAKVEGEQEDESLSYLVDDLDAIFSRYIRLKYLDEKTQLVPCYTCPSKLPLNQIQNGHFVHRTDMATRFSEDNCRPQCPICNSKHNDNTTAFKNALEHEQKGITQILLELSREVYKPSRDELKQLISEYRYKVKILEKQKLKQKQK